MLKKSFKILVYIVLVFSFCIKVKADSNISDQAILAVDNEMKVNNCLHDDVNTCELICSYSLKHNNSTKRVHIYYFKTSNEFATSFSWNGVNKVAFIFNKSYKYQSNGIKREYTNGVGTTAFIDPTLFDIDTIKNQFSKGEFKCNISDIYLNKRGDNEACYDNGNGYCKKYSRFKGDGKATDVELKYEISAEKQKNVEFNTNATNGISDPDINSIGGKSNLNKCLNDNVKKCELICSYRTDHLGKDTYVNIYYFKDNDEFATSFTWNNGNQDAFVINKKYKYQSNGIKREYTNGVGITAFADSSIFDSKIMRESFSNGSFSCPVIDIYKDRDSDNEICFDNKNGYCKKISSKDFNDDEKIDNIITNYSISPDKQKKVKFAESLIPSCKVEESNGKDYFYNQVKSLSNLNDDDIYSICIYANKDANPLDKADLFVVASLKDEFKFYRYLRGKFDPSGNFSHNTYDSEINYTDYKDCYIYMDDTIYLGKKYFGGDYVWQIRKKALTSDTEYNLSCKNQYIERPAYEVIEVNDCKGLLGAELIKKINSVMFYLKIAVPIIIITLGSLDFGRAMLSSNEENMKKAQNRFFMRLLIGMVIFFIPTFINIFMSIADQVWGIASGSCDIVL